MRTFDELINAGVAQPRYQFLEKPLPNKGNDPINFYNNTYGGANDTFAQLGENGELVIHGSIIMRDKLWNEFINATCWGKIEFPMPVVKWVEGLGYDPNGSMFGWNGGVAYKFEKKIQ